MPTTKGVTATLTLDTETTPVTEHATTISLDYASSYIIPTDHARFSITVSTTDYIHPCFDIGVWIDGVYQDGRIMAGDPKGFRVKFTGREVKGGRGLLKKLWSFGGLDVVDEGECEQGLNVLLNLGTIEIVVLRCGSGEEEDHDEDEDIPPHPHAKPYWNDWEADRNMGRKKSVKPILESHLKGRDLRHRVKMGKEFYVKRKARQKTVEYLDSFENPYCILVFEYRSLEALQNMDVIPRSPSPESDSDLSDTDNEEEQEVEEEIGRLEAMSREEILRELIAVKKLQVEKGKTKIKQEQLDEWEEEREQGRAKKRAKVKIEVTEAEDRVFVDLTDD